MICEKAFVSFLAVVISFLLTIMISCHAALGEAKEISFKATLDRTMQLDM